MKRYARLMSPAGAGAVPISVAGRNFSDPGKNIIEIMTS
jgi:hypothetical protein